MIMDYKRKKLTFTCGTHEYIHIESPACGKNCGKWQALIISRVENMKKVDKKLAVFPRILNGPIMGSHLM